jgi:integrase
MVNPLKIPPAHKRVPGMAPYCQQCKRMISKGICLEEPNSRKSLRQCVHQEKHGWKMYVSEKGSGVRRTKNLKARDFDSASIEALLFRKEVKENKIKSSGAQSKATAIDTNNTPQLLLEALARYSGWLKNENVPKHLQKERDSQYTDDIERKLKLLIVGLKKKGHNLSSFRVDDLNDKAVGDVVEFLDTECNYSPRTYNKFFSYASSFLKWFSEEYYPVRAWFKRVPKKNVGGADSEPHAITKREYEALLKVTTPENGMQIDKITGKDGKEVDKARNYYRPYLKDAYKLALETGRRRHEIINFKYSGINKEKGYLKVEDFKVNNIQKRKDEKEKKYIYVPLTESLWELLNELGYEKYKNTDEYILAPEIKNKRNKVMSDYLSRAFTHYYKQLNTGRELTFKSFRKAYITQLTIFMGNQARMITGHGGEQVMDQHYRDKEIIAKAAQNFKVFSDESERENELHQVRTKSTKQKTMEVAK